MISLPNWLHPARSARDGLTQRQREAIVDLLNYCAVADRDISYHEEVAIEELKDQLDWDPNTDFDFYMDQSIGTTRAAAESHDPAFFLEQVRSRLDSPNSRELAISLCEKLIESEGRPESSGNELLAMVREVLISGKS